MKKSQNLQSNLKAVAHRWFPKNMVWKNSQNSDKNTCAENSFLVKLEAAEFFPNSAFTEHLWTAQNLSQFKSKGMQEGSLKR